MKEPIANSTNPTSSSPVASASTPPADAPPHVITKCAITGWVLYDLANTIVSNMVLFTKNVAENSGMNQNQADEQAH